MEKTTSLTFGRRTILLAGTALLAAVAVTARPAVAYDVISTAAINHACSSEHA